MDLLERNHDELPDSRRDELKHDVAIDDIAILNDLFQERYRVLKKLGKGSQGSVFLAETTNGEKVAIKQLRIQSVKDWKQYDLFHREAETLKRLHIHGVAQLIEVAEFLDIEEPRACIVQEYIEGDPLETFIAKGHRFTVSQIGSLMLSLVDIVEKLHKSDPPVIHRDIKPSNILLRYEANNDCPVLNLIDFGAVSNPQVKSGGSTVVGTYGYMAPEQLMGHATAASDIYSIAIVAVYLLSGTPPEQLETQDFHILIDPHLEHLPHQITSFLRQMLAPNADERMTDYNTIRTFFKALAEQRFDAIPACRNDLTSACQYAVTDVHTYMQAGNIELWQALSDVTPRNCPLGNASQRIKYGLGISKSELKSIGTNMAKAAACCFGVVGGLAAASGLSSEAFFIIGACAAFFVCIIVALSYWPKWIKRLDRYSAFVSTARKSMATVIRIEYEPYLDMSSQLARWHSAQYAGKRFTPTWTVTYSFNPPDDSSPDALIHSVKTHTMPTHIKEGSLIPILYTISNRNGDECVQSMPFPMPACDVMDNLERIP